MASLPLSCSVTGWIALGLVVGRELGVIEPHISRAANIMPNSDRAVALQQGATSRGAAPIARHSDSRGAVGRKKALVLAYAVTSFFSRSFY